MDKQLSATTAPGHAAQRETSRFEVDHAAGVPPAQRVLAAQHDQTTGAWTLFSQALRTSLLVAHCMMTAGVLALRVSRGADQAKAFGVVSMNNES